MPKSLTRKPKIEFGTSINANYLFIFWIYFFLISNFRSLTFCIVFAIFVCKYLFINILYKFIILLINNFSLSVKLFYGQEYKYTVHNKKYVLVKKVVKLRKLEKY